MKRPLTPDLSWLLILTIIGFLGASAVNSYGIKFIVEPQDTIVPTGGSGVLNCAARGIPPTNLPKISWKKDGSLISFVGDTRSEEDESYFRRSILANGSLHITSLFRTREARPDEGMYQCFVTLDGVGSILSRSAKLQTSSLARFDEEPEDISISLGQTARFSCSAQGIPPPTIVWIKDGQQLTLDLTRMTILPSGSLEISHIQQLDEGTYHCNITNGDKFAVSRDGHLTINRTPARESAPIFTAVPKSQNVMASQSVVLECSAVGYPIPTLSWLKNGKTIDFGTLGNRYALTGEGNLAISNVDESDKGTIVCRAENHEDSADVSATLDVQVPPRVLTTPGNFYAYEKEDVELPCKIYGKPAPIIQWYKNGDMIIEGDYFQIINGNNLKILGCLSSDTAMYQCFGTNPSGNVQASMHLRVLKKGEEIPPPPPEYDFEIDLDSSLTGEILPPTNGLNPLGNVTLVLPSEPRDLVALLVSTRFVTLSWKPPAHLNSGKLIGYSIYYKELGSDRERVLNTTEAEVEEVNIQGLQPNKRYTFRVVPYDDKVIGQSSTEITVLTQPEVDVPGQPRFLKAWPVSPTRVDLRWAPPEVTNGKIERYKVYYAEALDHGNDGSDLEKFSTEELETLDELDEDDDYLIPKNGVIQSTTVTSSEASLEDLRIFTEYFIWVVALNVNGAGTNSDQIRVTTLSDAPTDTPHNVSAEPASSTSIVIRWDPPPLEFRNGIITGYKLKYKQKGRKRAETLTTDGNSRSLAMNDLDRGVEYQLKIAALNVNGTGPFTEWVSAATFPRDLDESQVPEKPNSLVAQASVDSITITWSPPLNSNTMVRGYTIGWGKGIPDVYQKVVDGKKRSYTIEKLQPNFEYVISLRASNQVGDGIPIYENVRTRETSDELEGSEDHHPRFRGPQLATPTGLRAVIISSTSAVLSWTDTSLTKSQIVSDRRYYTVRYTPTDFLGLSRSKPVYKHINSTALNLIINNLKGNTMYEFSVKVSKNRLSSEWSLVVTNKTLSVSTSAPPTDFGGTIGPSAGPGSGSGSHTSPQDLTLLAITGTDDTSTVILNWQPPKLTRSDDLRGYLIYYTTNPQRKEWVEEVVSDDILTYQVSNLTPDTKYFFRMVTRLNKSLSPHTEIKTVLTPSSTKGHMGIVPGGKVSEDAIVKTNQMILYILIALSVTFALGSVMLCIYYRKKGVETSPKHGSLKKTKKQPDLKPPDLWIHHDQMELKGIDKGRGLRAQAATPLSPSNGSIEFGDLEEKVPLQHSTNSLERGGSYMSSYAESQPHQSHSLGRRKPKPIRIPTDFSRNSDFGYKRNNQSQNLPPSLPGLDAGKTYDSFQSGSSTASSQQNINGMGQYASASSDYATQSGTSSLGTLGRRTNSGLRSFTVPIPPIQPGPPPHQQPNIVGTPQNSKIIRPVGPPHHHPSSGGSPVRRISATPQFPLSPPGYNMTLSSMGGTHSPGMSPNSGLTNSPIHLHKSYSTEDLSQEISNLEGLMKDLNAITASEFQC